MTQQCNDLEDALIRESSRNGSYPFEVGVKDFDSKRESCMQDKLLLNETGIPAIWTAPSLFDFLTFCLFAFFVLLSFCLFVFLSQKWHSVHCTAVSHSLTDKGQV